MKRRVLLTGAFGNIGRRTIPFLVRDGVELVATDVSNKCNRAHDAKLRAEHGFTTQWVDVTDAAAVERLVKDVAPTHIVHLASVIPPYIYANPTRSMRINVDGTKHLIHAVEKHAEGAQFVLASSHTVHGCRNGLKDLPRLGADSPIRGTDIYTRGKILCEEALTTSTLRWTILRFGVVFPLDYSPRLDPHLVRLSFLVPLNSRTHGTHLLDAGLATARSLCDSAVGKVLMIGGDDRWTKRHRYFISSIIDAVGVGMLPEAAYVQPGPEQDDGWFYNDWLDTTESQTLLDYQHHGPDEYFAGLRRGAGILRPLTRMVAPIVRWKLAGMSPFYRDEVARSAHATTLEERLKRYSTPSV